MFDTQRGLVFLLVRDAPPAGALFWALAILFWSLLAGAAVAQAFGHLGREVLKPT